MSRFAIQYHNYSSFVQNVANEIHTKVQNNELEIPQSFGSGFVKGVDLGSGLSILMTEGYLRNEYEVEVASTNNDELYILTFHEIQPDSCNFESKSPEAIMLKTGVYFRSSLSNVVYCLPPGRIKTVSVIMSLHWLSQCANESESAIMLKHLNSIQPQEHFLQLMSIDYRIIVESLLHPVIKTPLKEFFIINRILLLIEKFFTKLYLGYNSWERTKNLTEEEVERLTVVESKLVNGSFDETPTIEDLAKMAAMSATKLKRSFKSIFGLPVYEYYQKYRMNVAKDILLSGTHTVKQVGQKVGYQNISHFASAFKKVHGLLPSQVLVKNR